MAMTIDVSFKKEEKWLYEKIKSESSSPGTRMKDIVILYYKMVEQQQSAPIPEMPKQMKYFDDSFDIT